MKRLIAVVFFVPCLGWSQIKNISNMRAFNKSFVSFVKGDAVDNNELKGLKGERPFSMVKNEYQSLQEHIALAAAGSGICRSTNAAMLCWEPVNVKGKIGMQFNQDKDLIFVSDAKNYDDLQIDFKKFTDGLRAAKKTSLFQFLLGEPAEAARYYAGQDGTIPSTNDFDKYIVLASYIGWVSIERNATEQTGQEISQWPDYALGGAKVTCLPKGEATVKMDQQGLSLKITTEKNLFKIESGGDEYSMALIEMPKNVIGTNACAERTNFNSTKISFCNTESPEKFYQITSAQRKEVDSMTFLGPRDRKVIKSAEQLVRKFANKIGQSKRVNISKENFGLNVDVMSGAELNQLKGIQELAKLDGAKTVIEPRQIADSLIYLKEASKCCQSAECRQAAYPRQNLTPAKGQNRYQSVK